MSGRLSNVIRNINSAPSVRKGGARLRAYCRFVKIQVRFRVLKEKSFLFDWENNIKLKAIKREAGTTECYYLGLYDWYEMNLLKKYLRQGDVFLDIGANIGSYSLLAASCGAEAYAFEPVPRTYRIMNEMMELNPNLQSMIHCRNAAVGESRGTLLMTDGDESTTNRVITENDDKDNTVKTVEVPSVKLDEEFTAIEVSAMKIDVEGFEESVLKGASQLLELKSLQLIIIEDFGSGKYDRLLSAKGFHRCSYDLKKLSDQNVVRRGNNSIFVKDISELNKKLYEYENQ